MNLPTVGEMRFHAAQAGNIDAMNRSLILVIGHLDNDVCLSWAQWLQVSLRYFYHNAPAVDILMAVGGGGAIESLAEKLAALPEPCDMSPDQDIPELTIGMADDTWWTWTGANAFYHSLSGDKIRHLGVPAMTMHTLNVTVLWYRCRDELRRFRDEHDTPAKLDEQSPAATA